ncbi:transposase [Pandoraea apista]|uniref:Transposase n=1 Tax=Pandoraea apista TaxID=93218 RepID=A0A5E5NYG0_9BURK|nr:transposase [Pandoraea apista]
MKKWRFTDSQIFEALKRAEVGLAPWGTGHQFDNVLLMALEARRYARVDDVAHEGA